MQPSRPILNDGAMRQVRGILREARLSLRETQIALLRLEGLTAGRAAAHLGIPEGSAWELRDRGIERLAGCRPAIYEVFAGAAAQLLRCERNSEESGAPALYDFRGAPVKLRSDQALGDLAERWCAWFLDER